MKFFNILKASIILLTILISTDSASNKATSTLKLPENENKMTYGERIFSPSPPLQRRTFLRQKRRRRLPQGHYSPITREYIRERRQNQRLLTDEERKRKLATFMKQQYLEFRRNLEESNEETGGKDTPINSPKPQSSLGTSSFQLPSHQTLIRRPFFSSSLLESSTEPNRKNSQLTVAIQSTSNLSALNMAKKLRSADEAPSSSRSAGIRPGSHPFIPLTRPLVSPLTTSEAQASQRASESATHKVLEERLGPSALPTFDPSIVVDFYSLLQATRQSQGLKRSKPTQGVGRALTRTGNAASPPSPQLLIQPESSEDGAKVVRRKLTQEPIPFSGFADTKSEQISKRAQYLQLPSNIGENSTMGVELSLYIAAPNWENENGSESNHKKKEAASEFGPHSNGNDPTAGVDPSQITVPNLDLSQLHLPQGVRDSLRKYLKPLISNLKPLRKSVPGLPGLDYPILSVVPYTNFYCSNMPWPGFYADTEARCQTWHACDVDGRQSTFLCPNGTVFNQALMVCDWWYNTDCLASPFLYPLNERLFGTLKSQEPVAPYTRITPELLDTIFT